VLHGLVLGTLFLLAFGGGLAGLYSLQQRLLTADGIRERTPRLLIGTWVMAIVASYGEDVYRRIFQAGGESVVTT